MGRGWVTSGRVVGRRVVGRPVVAGRVVGRRVVGGCVVGGGVVLTGVVGAGVVVGVGVAKTTKNMAVCLLFDHLPIHVRVNILSDILPYILVIFFFIPYINQAY